MHLSVTRPSRYRRQSQAMRKRSRLRWRRFSRLCCHCRRRRRAGRRSRIDRRSGVDRCRRWRRRDRKHRRRKTHRGRRQPLATCRRKHKRLSLARPSRTCRWRRRYHRQRSRRRWRKRRREDGEACRGARRALCDAQWRYQRALRERLVGRKATAGRQLALERQRRWCVRSVAMRLLRRRYGAWWRRG